MTFKEEIDLQLRENKTMSHEILTNLKDKNYFSGRNKQLGDTVLFGLLKEDSEDEKDEGEIKVRLITFHEEEIGVLYEEDSFYYMGSTKASKLPNIKRI